MTRRDGLATGGREPVPRPTPQLHVHGDAVAPPHVIPIGQLPVHAGAMPEHGMSVVVVVPPGDVVVVVVATASVICATPTSATAPGPGRSADTSTRTFPVCGTQNRLTSVDACAAPSA